MNKIVSSIILMLFFNSLKAQTAYYDAFNIEKYVRTQNVWKRVQTITDNLLVAKSIPQEIGDFSGDIKIYPEKDQTEKENLVEIIDVNTKRVTTYKYKETRIFFSGNDEDKKIISGILKNYFKDTWGDTKQYFTNLKSVNPFLAPYISSIYTSGGVVPTGFASLLSSLGNSDVTAFADGLAKFLVERTKEELNEAFFRKFADFLLYYPEFKTLFPNTNVLVNNFNSWEYSNLLNTLREAFDKDIKELLPNFIKLRNLTEEDCPDSAKNKKELCINCFNRIKSLTDFFKTNDGIFILSAAQMGGGILQNKKIPDIINSAAQPDFLLGYTDANNPQLASDFKNSLELINIISLSLKSNETGRNYISEAEFKLLETDPVLQQLYLGLLYQQISNANNGTGIVIRSVAVNTVITPSHVEGIKNYYTNLFNQSKNLQIAFNNLLTHKLDGKTDLSIDYATLFDLTNQLLEAATATSIIDPRLQCPQEVSKALEAVSKVFQISHDIAVRNYNAAVVGTLKLIADAAENYGATHPDSHLKEFTAVFLKYGSFAANVVNSKNPDDIKESIKSFVLPSGSSSLKKHTSFSVSLNSYVGFVYGSTKNTTYTTKTINGADSIVKLNGGKSIGIYAPVGVAFNWGLGWRGPNPWSLSAFVSLIDVGAVVGYRFITDTGQVSQKFKISLANIFAPGGNLILGLPNMPLSVGGGIQWIPSLQRDPKSNDFYNIDHSGFRGQIFIAVDLQLLNFHSSKKSLLYPPLKKLPL